MKALDDTRRPIGKRCDICTGCGRCGAVRAEEIATTEDGNGRKRGERGVRVLTADGVREDTLPLKSTRGERLVAADIGTTTIAMQLYREDGTVAANYVCVNPQTVYGADVLSRVQAAENGVVREEMRTAVLKELEAGIQKFKGCLAQGERMRMVLAGNTVMTYLLLGYDPAELGRAPFTATRLEAVKTEIDGVTCHIFPGQSAFVGGDITAGIYACGMHETGELTLLIDLGTNGEIVLGNRERMIACATAAGPAFEGGVNRGVWGADMVSILARLLRDGAMDETGLLADEYFDNGVRIADVRVTQGSVRAIQLAKAAIAAGIQILAQEYGVKDSGNGLEQIKRVVLAGGFGYYLNPSDAAAIGLLPRELADRTLSGGNTALSGCLRAGRELLIMPKNNRMQEKSGADRIFAQMESGGPWNLEVLNLAEHPDFEELYIASMEF